MAWPESWRAISARIEGLMRAGEYVVAALSRNSGDNLGIVRLWIAPELARITAEIKAFQQANHSDLPPTAADALTRFFAQDWFTHQPELINSNLIGIAALATFRSEFDYLLRDIEAEGRNSEVAFEHLQRLIAVDPNVREKWQEAYGKHEPACEGLGAVHLLSHEIFAFKIQGGDSITDLAYNEPLDEKKTQTIRQSVRAIVLTEWKLVRAASEVQAKATQARAQMGQYANGVLGDTELKRTRYIVLVSERQLAAVPPDMEVNGVKFRHINISVDPLNPSGAALLSRNPRQRTSATKGAATAKIKA